jgi:hypothetical protein
VVVVAGSSLQRERLVPDDLDLVDVRAVPDRLEHAVGQSSSEHVLHGRHGQEVIDAKDVALVHELGEKAIQRPRAVEVFPEGFLEHHLAVGGKPRPLERRDRDREDRRGQREVDRDRTFAGEACRNTRRVGEVEPPVARRFDHLCCRTGVDTGSLAEPVGRPVTELLVVPVLTAGGHELESLGEVPASLQGGQAGEQVPAHQVARSTEYEEPVDHVKLLARASVTPAAITPM